LKEEFTNKKSSISNSKLNSQYFTNEGEKKYVIGTNVDDGNDLVTESFLMTALFPKIYSEIRFISGFNAEEYYNSLEPSAFLTIALENQKFSEGRSGAFFVFAPNQRYIIKTISKTEYQSLANLTPKYYKHLKTYPESLLMRILGGYKIELFHTSIYVIVMDNIFCGLSIKESYDLKGSWVERYGDIGSTVKKDLDLKDNVFEIGNPVADQILTQLKHDAELLCNHNIIDYSLLVGLHFVDEKKIAVKNALKIQLSSDKRIIFVFGVIDILQSWNMSKKTEHFIKTYLLCKDKDGISIVPPPIYMKRFCTSLSTKIQ